MPRTITYSGGHRYLAEELERDPNVFYLGEDIGFGGVFGLSRGLQRKFGKARVFDCISETLIVGAGVGAAITGTRPVVERSSPTLSPSPWTRSTTRPPSGAMHGGLFYDAARDPRTGGSDWRSGCRTLAVSGGPVLVGARSLRGHAQHAGGHERSAQGRDPRR